jgi:uncharacterized SAM-binding protein YcdF (DUF218 family)
MSKSKSLRLDKERALKVLKRTRRLDLYLFVIFIVVFIFAFFREYEKVTSTGANAWNEDVSADCAVVLTGGPNRVREGLDLLSRGQVKKLIISGVYSNATLREIYPLWPFYGDVREQDVVLDRRSTTTFGNAQQSLPLVEALGCRDVALVTSNLHMYRAFRTFHASYPQQILLIPFAVNSGRGESTTWEVWTEVLKSMFYSLWAY